jgi:hypothetical protein
MVLHVSIAQLALVSRAIAFAAVLLVAYIAARRSR